MPQVHHSILMEIGVFGKDGLTPVPADSQVPWSRLKENRLSERQLMKSWLMLSDTFCDHISMAPISKKQHLLVFQLFIVII